MRLTTPMRAEVENIGREIDRITNGFFMPTKMEVQRLLGLTKETVEKNERFEKELNTYKVRLEIILCETDIKEQDQFSALVGSFIRGS